MCLLARADHSLRLTNNSCSSNRGLDSCARKAYISENQNIRKSNMPHQVKTSNTKGLTARVRSRNQLTLPQTVVSEAGLTEGAFVSVSVSKKRTMVEPGTIILAPQELSTRPWTDAEWQGAIAEGLADVKAGRLRGPYKGSKALITSLKKNRKKTK